MFADGSCTSATCTTTSAHDCTATRKLQTLSQVHKYIYGNTHLSKTYILNLIIRLTHANVWESMGKPCSCTQFIKSRIFYCKSRENPYQYCKSRENPYQYCKSRENPYQYCKSRENPYQVLQVTRESVSGTTSHVRCV